MKRYTSHSKVKMHDGIVGSIYIVSMALAVTLNIQWLILAALVAVLQVSSAFTGFCPVYYVLNRFMPEKDPMSAQPKVI